MLDFKQFLRESYNLKIGDLSEMEKPTLILISRKNTRIFMNEDQMVTMMKLLGFRVVIALVGAYGAGLTNAVFLQQGLVRPL
ncbi:hypothetical protein RHMOL_Rhmol06G0302100 [Rhododendron molle]|uniref:Uncharacterized protein n=1 Tax=Rhododendron molle TaxID=49168 RepID=A0ACC0NJ21_RHOML|nr:hypothetical protein RHMOL_Rhmol06G0302100 [Rhododendron molle]